jgi:hypothetical protein
MGYARSQVTLFIDWPVVPLADGVRTISEKCTQVEPRLRPEVLELQETPREACLAPWPVENFAASLEVAVANLCRIRTCSPGAEDRGGFPLAVCVGKSSHRHAVQHAAQELRTDRDVVLGASRAGGDVVL